MSEKFSKSGGFEFSKSYAMCERTVASLAGKLGNHDATTSGREVKRGDVNAGPNP